MLMWDVKKKKSKGMGIFGVVKAYGIIVEDKLNGNLHAHMIIIIDGVLKTSAKTIQVH